MRFADGYYLWRILVPKGEKCLPILISEIIEESEVIFNNGKILKLYDKKESDKGIVYDIKISGEVKEDIKKYYDKSEW